MCDLVKDSPAEWLLRETAVRFKDLTQDYSAYDFFILKQQVFRFFEDKHIKVSLFIQEGIQGLDGTIYLDFCGYGPIGAK